MEVAQQPNHRPLLWLLAIALAVRVYVLLVTFCVSKDALWFVPVAQAVAAGDFRPLLESHQQPLYPLLIVPFRAFGGSWVLSAQLASLAVGTLTIVPVFQLTRRVFGPEAAALAGLLAALLPHHCRFSADAISDATYIFLFASAVWLGGAAVIERRGRDFALCGALSALAWLTRPEGAGVVLLVCAMAALG
ncbi:MAG: glycosyltransferase family 39 protein, partial [Planctomycetes bacterium]|nr:glycosyltransferase family 39 protein [Planctomycetota bacterium]